MKHHPYAELFPLLTGTDFAELVADIKKNGLLNPIIIFEDAVLDGRNRENACTKAGVRPNYVPLKAGVDPLRFVVSQNIMRRHLTPVQRSFIAAKMANMKHGGAAYSSKKNEEFKNSSSGEPVTTLKKAAEMMDVGRDRVVLAKAVLDSGDEQLIADAQSGKEPLVKAAKQARAKKSGTAKTVKPRAQRPTPKLDDGIKIALDKIEETGTAPSRGEVQNALGGAASGTADTAIAHAKAYRKGYEDGLNAAAANPDLLGATYAARYQRVLKNAERIIAEQVEIQAKKRRDEWVKNYWLPDEEAKIRRMAMLQNRRTPFDYDEYRKLLAALHPDKPEGDDRVAMFQLVKERAAILRPRQREDELPVVRIRTYEELMAEKARREAVKKASRASKEQAA